MLNYCRDLHVYNFLSFFLSFSELANYVLKAGLTELLSKADGSFTVFAPDNNAFRNLPADKLSDPAALKQVCVLG